MSMTSFHVLIHLFIPLTDVYVAPILCYFSYAGLKFFYSLVAHMEGKDLQNV